MGGLDLGLVLVVVLFLLICGALGWVLSLIFDFIVKTIGMIRQSYLHYKQAKGALNRFYNTKEAKQRGVNNDKSRAH